MPARRRLGIGCSSSFLQEFKGFTFNGVGGSGDKLPDLLDEMNPVQAA